MTETICAKVNPKLLTKASRLFVGSIDGRIIEILQNARRAGATEVKINNKEGMVTVADNGRGIDDFGKLLDLGGSGWDEQLEVGEDPAGVGLFCLAPREVTIISGDKKVVICENGWSGKQIEITEAKESVNGTIITFTDEKCWDKDLVEKHAVFAGIRVVVDGAICHSMPFCSSDAVNYDDPGCRIEVVRDVSKYHKEFQDYYYRGGVLVNFHGQVVQLDHWPTESRQSLTVLVDLNSQSDIRLMLPARTKLIENDALEKLKAAIEVEFYRYFKRQKSHSLYYKEFLRAKELGIELDEAEPKYELGLLHDGYDQCVEVFMPEGMNLKDCYLCLEEDFKDESSMANAHLLSGLGKFNGKPFVPVTINSGYRGYSWADLPKVVDVKVVYEEKKLGYGIGPSEIACYDKLSISVETCDGKTFASDVFMAIIELPSEGEGYWNDPIVGVTKDARINLNIENIWYHLGGFDEEGDSYDTQLDYFEKDLDEFWSELVGPYESLRQQIQSLLSRQYNIREKWKRVIVNSDDSLELIFNDGKTELVIPPEQA